LEGISDNDLKVSNTNKNYPKLFAESQNIDLTDLKEYTVIEQKLLVVPVESGQTISLNNLFFETASWVLKKESSIELNRVVKILTENPSIKIEIGGHTDDKGSDETNKTLSEKRAFEVYSYLITKSISKERLIYVGYGESKPKVPNTTESNRATNRRVELKIR
jgi:outer membrane protein OmpA-like peptidoglycan-associated protein